MENISVIYNRIWKTRGARFNAHSRYLVQAKMSTFTIGILSSYIIVISLLHLSDSFSDWINTSDLTILTLAASLLTLVFSQLEGTKEYKLCASKMHDNALKLSNVYNKAQHAFNSNKDSEFKAKKAKIIQKEYQTIIANCDMNHNSEDYKLFLARNYSDPGVNMHCALAFGIRVWTFFFIRMYYLAWIILPIIIFLTIVCINS